MQTGWLLKRNPITGSHQMICSCPFIRSLLSAIYTGWLKTSSLVLWWHISVSRPTVGFDSPALLLSLLYTPWLFPRVDADMLAHLSGSHRDFTAAIFILLSKKNAFYIWTKTWQIGIMAIKAKPDVHFVQSGFWCHHSAWASSGAR